MKSHLILMVITVLLLARFADPAAGQDLSFSHAVSESPPGEGRDASHSISFTMVTNWGAKPPTAKLTGAITRFPPSYSKEIPENEKPKWDVTLGSTPSTLNLAGDSHSDGVSDNQAGFQLNAAGYWETFDTEIDFNAETNGVDVIVATSALAVAIDPRSPDAFGTAVATISDPIPFPPLAAGDTVMLDTMLHAGQSLQATGSGQASKWYFAGTDIPGYETLYEVKVNAWEADGTPSLSVDFTSHPALGLDDAAVGAGLFGEFDFDATEKKFVLGSDLPLFSGALPLPLGQPFNLHLEASASAEVRATAVIEPPDGAAVIMSPVAVHETGFGTEFGTQLENMNNQSGLVEPFVSGETPFDEYIETGLLANGRAENVWSSRLLPNGEPNAELVLDFGEIVTMDRLAIWNATLKDIRLAVATSAEGPWQEVGSFTLEHKLGTESAYGADVLGFGQDYDAQFVRIHVDSLYRPTEESAWFAVVNEVAVSVPVPEPTTFVLLAIGLAALLGRCGPK